MKTHSDDKKQNRRRWFRLAYALSIFFVLFMAALLASVAGACHASIMDSGTTMELSDGWQKEDGTPVRMPVFTEWSADRLSYTVILPSADKELRAPVLFFTSRYINAYFYLDDVLLGESLAKPQGAASSLGEVYTVLQLPEDYAGRQLRLEIELMLGKHVSYEIPAPVIGSQAGAAYGVLRKDIIFVLVDLAILCFGITLCLFGLQRGKLYKGGAFLYTALFAMFYAAYSLCTTSVIHLFYTNSSQIYVFEFLLLALLPVPFVAVFERQCRKPYRGLLQADMALLTINLLLQTGIHFFSALEVRNTVFITHGLMMLSLILLILSLLFGWNGSGKVRVIFTFSPIFLGTLADLLLFYFSKTYRSSFWVTVGVLIFILLQTYGLVREYFERYESDLTAGLYRQMAYQDALTGLENRAAFEARIEELSKSVDTYSSLWCVCADINNLKQVNDNAGHATGDQLICGAAEALKTITGGEFPIYRTGGDEFVLFITDWTEQDVENGCARLKQAMEEYNRTHEAELSIAVGYEGYCFTGNDTAADLVSRADQRMYEDKRRNKEGQCLC